MGHGPSGWHKEVSSVALRDRAFAASHFFQWALLA